MKPPRPRLLAWCLLACLALPACASPLVPSAEEEEADPPEVAVGERLFQETRFAQFFFAHSGGQINSPLAQGDPVMDLTEAIGQELPGPFAGQSMNCAACHMVDQQLQAPGGGMRSYGDFARRSPIPQREDGRTTAPRNSPPLVNSALPRANDLFLHFDGEFTSLEDLVRGTFTGRNFGWLPGEAPQAVANLAKVIREDDGSDAIANLLGFSGWSYRALLGGADPNLPPDFLLPEEFRIDVDAASDQEIFDAVARLVAAYVRNLVFSQNQQGEFNGSPYDKFLILNDLPRKPAAGESDLEYSRRLMRALQELKEVQFVDPAARQFQFHEQDFAFGPEELAGMKIFFREPDAIPLGSEKILAGGIGNCIACHAAPNFTDFSFHNVGTAQREYDKIHGQGSFSALSIPGFAARSADPEAFLPPTAAHPGGTGVFLAVPAADRPGHTDLGVWNVFGNADIPKPQAALRELLCRRVTDPNAGCTAEELLPLSIALFKTPGLRDLGHSSPYMHTGQLDGLDSVLMHYFQFSAKAREGAMRNSPPEFQGMALRQDELPDLLKFLKSLNEDYN
ncbi:MAG: cytochrome c peroxidase [bacterium]